MSENNIDFLFKYINPSNDDEIEHNKYVERNMQILISSIVQSSFESIITLTKLDKKIIDDIYDVQIATLIGNNENGNSLEIRVTPFDKVYKEIEIVTKIDYMLNDTKTKLIPHISSLNVFNVVSKRVELNAINKKGLSDLIIVKK